MRFDANGLWRPRLRKPTKGVLRFLLKLSFDASQEETGTTLLIFLPTRTVNG